MISVVISVSPQVGTNDVQQLLGRVGVQGFGVLFGVHQVRAHMVFDDLRHQSGHRAARARDQVHDLVTSSFARERPLDTLDLASDAAHARQQFLLLADGVTHSPSCHTYPPYAALWAVAPSLPPWDKPTDDSHPARVMAWSEEHQDQCYTSSIVVAHLAFWVRTKRGKQRIALQKWLTDLIEAAHGRLLGLNVSTAHVWAEQQHQFQAAGTPMPVEASYITAIARRHNLTVVTGNVKDFQRPGVRVFDPFTEIDSTER